MSSQGAAGGGVGRVLIGVDPDGEELCVEIAFLCGVVVEHAAVEWVGEVPVLVDEALWGVGVGVDDDGARVDLSRVGHAGHLFVSCYSGCLRVQKRARERAEAWMCLQEEEIVSRWGRSCCALNMTIVAMAWEWIFGDNCEGIPAISIQRGDRWHKD